MKLTLIDAVPDGASFWRRRELQPARASFVQANLSGAFLRCVAMIASNASSVRVYNMGPFGY